MVVKLTGKVDGRDVIFTPNGDRWETIVPYDLYGEYIIELQAWDEAGNMEYTTRCLFVVNPTGIHIELIPPNYYATLE